MDYAHRNLYKRPGSPYWYVGITYQGRTIRKSTGTKDKRKAARIAGEYRARLQADGHYSEWVSRNVTQRWIRSTLTAAKRRARSRSLPFSLSADDLYTIATRSRGVCEVSGIPFSDAYVNGNKKRPFVASLDRINSDNGYTTDNCRLVCMVVNFAMSDWGEEVIRTMAKGIILRMIESELALDSVHTDCA